MPATSRLTSGPRRKHLPAGERQQPMRQNRCPFCGGLSRRDMAAELPDLAPRQAPLKEFQAATDAGEHVVEVVCEAAGSWPTASIF